MKTNQKGQKTYHKHKDNFPPSLLFRLSVITQTCEIHDDNYRFSNKRSKKHYQYLIGEVIYLLLVFGLQFSYRYSCRHEKLIFVKNPDWKKQMTVEY